MMPVPILDLERRRKKESIGIRCEVEVGGALGAGVARIKRRRYGTGEQGSLRMVKKLVAGNWKMHGVSSDVAEIRAIAEGSRQYPSVDVALCLPSILIHRAVEAVPGFPIGGQDVHHAEKGAHTGCTSAQMLEDSGARLTIVGHTDSTGSDAVNNPLSIQRAQSVRDYLSVRGVSPNRIVTWI